MSSLSSPQLQAVELESNASFGFMPGVFAQSWHRKLSDTYTCLRCVGEGRSGAVFIVQHKRTQKHFACKVLLKVDHDAETLRREIGTLRRLDHPNIVRLFEVNEDQETVFILMELCHGGDLYDKIYDAGRLDESTVKSLAQQMLSALAYCHASGVVHRDVKPENFLLEHADDEFPTLKLADFGIATSIRPEHVSGSCADCRASGSGAWPSFCDLDSEQPGSLPYMAPEMFMHRWRSLVANAAASGSPEILAASDCWSCGVSIYVMLSGELPFGEDEQRICSGRLPSFEGEAWASVSREAIDLISRLLNSNVEERWTAQQALGHEWFRAEESPCDQFTSEVLSPGVPASLACPDFVGAFLRVLRSWRQLPKLRRIVIVAIARWLEEQHEIHRVAQAALALFSEGAERDGRLSCEHLVELLNTATCDPSVLAFAIGELQPFSPSPGTIGGNSGIGCGRGQGVGDTLAPAPCTPAHDTPGAFQVPGAIVTTPSPASTVAYPSSASPGSAPARSQRGTRTGLHVRRRMRNFARSLSGLAEETPTPTPTPTPGSSSTPSRGFGACAIGSCFSLTELRYLVDSLDGQKDGYIDYTLLLASLLPPEVYCDEGRIAEVFELFDLQKRGSVGPRDFYMAVLGGSSSGGSSRRWRSQEPGLRQISEMLNEFDLDGDGRLNLAEFQAMVRGVTRDDRGAVDGEAAPSS